MSGRDTALPDTAMLASGFGASASTSAPPTMADSSKTPAMRLSELKEVFARAEVSANDTKRLMGVLQRQQERGAAFASQKQQEMTAEVQKHIATAAENSRANMARITAQASGLMKRHGPKSAIRNVGGVKRLNVHVKLPLITSAEDARQKLLQGKNPQPSPGAATLQGVSTHADLDNKLVQIISEQVGHLDSRVFKLDKEKSYKVVYVEPVSMTQGATDLLVYLPLAQNLDTAVSGTITHDRLNDLLNQNGSMLIPACHSIVTGAWKHATEYLYMNDQLMTVLKTGMAIGAHHSDGDDSDSDSEDSGDGDEDEDDSEEHTRKEYLKNKKEFLDNITHFLAFWDEEAEKPAGSETRRLKQKTKFVVLKCAKNPEEDRYFVDVYSNVWRTMVGELIKNMKHASSKKQRKEFARLAHTFRMIDAVDVKQCYYFPLASMHAVVQYVRDYIELVKAHAKFEIATPEKDRPLKNVRVSLPALSCVGRLNDILHFACVPAQVAEYLHSGKTSADAWEVWQSARAPHHTHLMSGQPSHITLNLTVGVVEYVPISDEDTRVRLARDLPASAVTMQKEQYGKHHHTQKETQDGSGSDDEEDEEEEESDDEDKRVTHSVAKGSSDDEDEDDEDDTSRSRSESESDSE